MRIVARRLSPLNISFVFGGGAALCVLVDNPDLMDLRPTLDVDVVVSAVSYAQYSELEAVLRRTGFRHDQSKDAPICRWIIDGCKVDIMPQDSSFLGMNSKWFAEVMESATAMNLGEGCIAKVITPACFLATKLQAFSERGQSDYYGSKDLEDIVTLVDGREAIVTDVRDSRVQDFVSKSFARLLECPEFRDALPGHLSQMYSGEARRALVLDRFGQIAQLRRS